MTGDCRSSATLSVVESKEEGGRVGRRNNVIPALGMKKEDRP
jgi:hypothetical protein